MTTYALYNSGNVAQCCNRYRPRSVFSRNYVIFSRFYILNILYDLPVARICMRSNHFFIHSFMQTTRKITNFYHFYQLLFTIISIY